MQINPNGIKPFQFKFVHITRPRRRRGLCRMHPPDVVQDIIRFRKGADIT